MRLQIATRIALYAILQLADDPRKQLAAAEIAERFGISVNHLAKVLRTLGRAGLVEALRGVGGGYRFRGNAKRVTLLHVQDQARFDSHLLPRLHEFNAIDRFEDSKRKVRVAADQLRADLTFFGTATLASEALRPNVPSRLLALARKLIEEYGVRGFKFHPTMQGFYANDRLAYPLYEEITNGGAIALFHTGQTGVGSGMPGGMMCLSSNGDHDGVIVGQQDAEVVRGEGVTLGTVKRQNADHPGNPLERHSQG